MAHPLQPSAEPAPPGAGTRPAGSAGARAGVPLSVWPAIPPPGPCPASLVLVPCPQRWPAVAAAAVVTALSGPGDLVVVTEPGTGVFLAAAAGAGRRALGLAGTPGYHRNVSTALDRTLSPAVRRLARLRSGGPAALLTGACREAGQAALTIITTCTTPGCPLPAIARPGVTASGPGLVYAACQHTLAPGGVLAVITNAAHHPGHPGEITARARAAGLVYTQHIIAVHATIRDSRLHLPAATRPPGGRGPAGPHRPVHSDILLFRRPGGPHHD